MDSHQGCSAASASIVRIGGYDVLDVSHAPAGAAPRVTGAPSAYSPIPDAEQDTPSTLVGPVPGFSSHTTDTPSAASENVQAPPPQNSSGGSRSSLEGFNDRWQIISDRETNTAAEILQQAVDMHKLATVFTDRARFLAELIASERTMHED